MTVGEKITYLVLPGLLVIGLGVLEISFPHAMDGFDDGYTGRKLAGVILLLIELLLWLTWGKIGGSIAIVLGAAAIVFCLFVNEEHPEVKITENPTTNHTTDNDKGLTKSSTRNALASAALRAGKNYAQRKLKR